MSEEDPGYYSDDEGPDYVPEFDDAPASGASEVDSDSVDEDVSHLVPRLGASQPDPRGSVSALETDLGVRFERAEPPSEDDKIKVISGAVRFFRKYEPPAHKADDSDERGSRREPEAPPPHPSPADIVRSRLRGRLGSDRLRGQKSQIKPLWVGLIPIDHIDRSYIEPFRFGYDEELFRSLLDDVDENGQQTPIKVVEKGGVRPYGLMCGEKRLIAVQATGSKDVLASIYGPMTLEQAQLLSIGDNTFIQKLSDYEIAHAYVRLRDEYGTTTSLFSKFTGVGESKIKVLSWIFDSVPVEVLEGWKEQDPLLTRKVLTRLAGMDRANASSYWADWRVRLEASHATPAPRRTFRRDNRRLGEGAIASLYVAVMKNPREMYTREEVQQMLDCIIGRAARVPGLWDPSEHRSRRRRERAEYRRELEVALPLRARGNGGGDE